MRLIPLLFTVFIDSLGFGLVFPIFSHLIINNEGGMFASQSSLALRGLAFGFLVSTYCVGQFFGGPLLGSLSDRLGRKKVLVASMWLAFLGYILAGIGTLLQIIVILFLARIVCGIAAGSFSVAQSAIADSSLEENKTKNFGLVGMACWSGFIIGPYVGGKMAAYGFVFPFLTAAFLCLLSAIWLLFCLQDTTVKNAPKGKIPWLQGVYQIRQAFAMPVLRGIFIVMFICSLGWGFFTEFSPVYLNKVLGFSIGQIANFYAWVGLWIAICQGLVIRPILKKFSPKRLLLVGFLLLGMTLPVIFFLTTQVQLFCLVPCFSFAQALIFPTSATLVSNQAANDKQGEVLGIHNSVQWAAIALPPLFSGSLVALFPSLPIFVGSFCMFVSFLVFLINSRVKEINPTREE